MKEKMDWGFTYTPEVIMPCGKIIACESAHNIITNQGIEHLTGLMLGTSPLIGSWYIGLFARNYVPTLDTTAADLPVSVGETVGYTSPERPLWTPDIAGGGIIDNLNSRANFEGLSGDIFGAFLVSSPAKGTGGGLLFSIARFPSPVSVPEGSSMALRIATVFVTS